MGELIASHEPDLVVIACNTASTLVLPALREKFSLPFVGTVPAIKPACAASVTRRVSVLGTEATVAREYTHALIRDFAQDCRVTLVGSRNLAAYAEAEMDGAPVSDEALRAEITLCFHDDGARTDTVVLACTHYPLLIERLRQLRPLAGGLHRSGARHRAARHGPAGPGIVAVPQRHRPRHFHLRPAARGGARTLRCGRQFDTVAVSP